MATQVMIRPIGERLLRLMPSPGMPLVQVSVSTTFFLAVGCVELLSMVEELKRTYGPLQMLRMVAVAHVFRFLQSILGENQVPRSFYLRKVLPFYDLPITLAIAAFYISLGIFPKTLVDFVPVVLLLLLSLLVITSKVPTQASLSNTELVDQQDAAAIDLILPIMEFFEMEAKDTVDIEVSDHFAIILLTGMCVDLVVQVERVRGTYELTLMVLVLALRHLLCFHIFLYPNSVPPFYYLRKVLIFYDIPFTATFAIFFGNLGTPSNTLILGLILELSLLAWIHISISRVENLNITQPMEAEEHISPTQASTFNTDAANNSIPSATNFDPWETEHYSGKAEFGAVSLNTELVHQHNHDAADNSVFCASNFSQWEIRDPPIGEGGFAFLHVASNRVTGDLCAMKKLKNPDNLDNVRSLTKEIEILSQLEHPNIVKYYGNERVGDQIWLFMEYVDTGTLTKYISEQGAFRERFVRDTTVQILSALAYLHTKSVVHRDIKPDNILVDTYGYVKLIDFGMAKHVNDSMGCHSMWGTSHYAAPETLQNQEYSSSGEAYRADIRSLGCVIIEMFTGRRPWNDLDWWQVNREVCWNRRDPEIPQDLSEEGKEFLQSCFERDPAKRLSASQLLQHPFVY